MVRIVLINPDGQQSGTPGIAQVSGTAKNGEWRHAWSVNSNTGTTQKVYGIQAWVSDAGGNVGIRFTGPSFSSS
jgi:hypothetical protein